MLVCDNLSDPLYLFSLKMNALSDTRNIFRKKKKKNSVTVELHIHCSHAMTEIGLYIAANTPRLQFEIHVDRGTLLNTSHSI